MKFRVKASIENSQNASISNSVSNISNLFRQFLISSINYSSVLINRRSRSIIRKLANPVKDFIIDKSPRWF